MSLQPLSRSLIVRCLGVTVGLLIASCGSPPPGSPSFDSTLLVPSPEPPAEPCRATDGLAVFFAPGSSELDPSLQPDAERLRQLARACRQGAFHHVRLTGWVEAYCPSAPSTAELAMERVRAVRDRLEELGLPPDAIQIAGTLPAGTVELTVDEACDPRRPMPLRTVQIEAFECVRDEEGGQ